LRALYFALAAVLHRFAHLKQALAVLLIFIGSKIFVADLLGLEKFPAAYDFRQISDEEVINAMKRFAPSRLSTGKNRQIGRTTKRRSDSVH
jgi:predicted tellurium resistance membrane protein TerC